MRLESEPCIVQEGYPFILLAAVTAIFFGMLGWKVPAAVFFVLTLCIVAFFRNPARRIPEDQKAVLSPADGKVLNVERLTHTHVLDAPGWKISIFMNVHNVHVNRVPASGTVLRKRYHPGKFFVASRDKASENNERMELLIRTDQGHTIGVVQIAGWVARRIVCYPEQGDRVIQGARLGLIRFGSRVELYVTEGATITIRPGESTKGGETIIGHVP